jgi:hypothetical protein
LAPTAESLADMQGRRKRRFQAVAVIAAVFVAGNIIDLVFWPWGRDHSIAVFLSAGMFWVAFSMFVLCCRDLVSVWTHDSQPPTLTDLVNAGYVGSEETGLVGGFKGFWKAAGLWVESHVALVGLIGFFVGAIIAHIGWRVGP